MNRKKLFISFIPGGSLATYPLVTAFSASKLKSVPKSGIRGFPDQFQTDVAICVAGLGGCAATLVP